MENRNQREWSFKKFWYFKSGILQRFVATCAANPDKGGNREVTELTDGTKLFTIVKIKTDREVAEGFKI